MLYLRNSNIKEGRVGEFIAWVEKNKGVLEKHSPKGWTLRGVYMAVLGFGRYDVTFIWEIGDYSDFDTAREWKSKVWNRSLEEMESFFLPGMGESTLLREVDDVVLVESEGRRK